MYINNNNNNNNNNSLTNTSEKSSKVGILVDSCSYTNIQSSHSYSNDVQLPLSVA